jgi:two-component system, OmpR family, alkaline phosphatase synthesis response regulator PhoP
MIHPLVIARDAVSKSELRLALVHNSLTPSFASYSNGFRQDIANENPEILVLEVGDGFPGQETWDYIRKIKLERGLPAIALVQRESLESIEHNPFIDDFLATPYDAKELVLRINRLLHRVEPAEAEKGKGLVIDYDTCEVTVDGNKVDLTFKEYELIKILAGSKGHVFTREALLNKVWGYDYYGGDRTVDVHIRRLRSKIEKDQVFIETVRNIGYRFVKGD